MTIIYLSRRVQYFDNSYLNDHFLSEWVLFNANSAIYQLYHGENELIVNQMMITFCTRLKLFLIVLFHWNTSPRIDMSPHSDTLFWFRANQSLLFLFNAAFLAEKQQIPIV